MPGSAGIITGLGFPLSGQVVYGLVVGLAGTPITQSTVTAITYTVTRLSATGVETVTATGSLTVSAVVFNTLQDSTADSRIPDGEEANFIAVIPASAFPVAGRGLRHRIEVLFDPASGEDFCQDWQITLQ